MIKKRVAVAMSGGVDSSVAAWLLKKQGFEVIGVTMRFGRLSLKENIEDAKHVAEKIGIKHYVFDFSKELDSLIIDNFCQEYLQGRTPNPCIRCNRLIKFDALLKKAKQLNAQFIATGHFARVVYSPDKKIFILKKGLDKQKDQSYFLYRINKEALPYILLPLGNYTKQRVRTIAKNIGIKVADKPGSQEICFIKEDYRDFLKNRLAKAGVKIKPGPIVDLAGKILGTHQGICFYTLGQREGLGIALGYRAYIVKIDKLKNTIVVGKEEDLYSKVLIAEKSSFISMGFPKKSILAKAKIRYNHKEASCRMVPLAKDRIKVEFLKPQRAITPGQSVVFYRGDTLLGGGIIKS